MFSFLQPDVFLLNFSRDLEIPAVPARALNEAIWSTEVTAIAVYMHDGRLNNSHVNAM